MRLNLQISSLSFLSFVGKGKAPLSSARVSARVPEVLTSALEVVTSNIKVMTSDAKVMTSNAKVMTSNTKVMTSNTKVKTSNTKVKTSNTKVMTSNTKVMTSNTKVMTSNQEICGSNLMSAFSRLKVLILMFTMLCCGIFNGVAQPLADIGLYNSGNDTLEVRLIPKGFFNGVASNVVFTIRWESGCGSSLGNIVQSGTPATYLPMTKSGTPQTANGYTYQVFGGAGLQTLSLLGVSWANGVPVTLLKVPVVNPAGTFEIVNDLWTGVVTNNGDYFVSLNGQKKTGVISPGKFSFVQTGSASICQGDSILLGGVYRKLPGTYYDTLQGACKNIVLTTLTITGANTSTQLVSICQGESYFAGGAWQTTSGTYYDLYNVGNGCDSAIITQLTVHPVYFNTINIQICQGQSIIAGGDYRTQSGIYYDTLSSRYGCDSVIATDLQVLPHLSSSRNISICAGQSYFAGGNNQTTSGTYFDTYATSGGCDSIVTTILTVNSNPVVTISPSTVSICSGSSIILSTGGGASYFWSTGANSPAIIVSPSSSTTYSVTVTNSSGCTASASRSVTVNSSPAAFIFPPTVSICSGASATLTTSGGTSYIWSNGATLAFITVNPAVTTTYSVTITGSNGCTVEASRTITVNPFPPASISPATVAVCEGASTTLTASGGTSYTWSTGANAASITVSPTVITNYSVTVTSASGCTATTSSTVLVNALPTASISPADVSICSGTSATLTAGGGSAYSWNTGATAENLTVNPTVTTSYSVTVTNVAGCSSTVSRTIIVNPTPSASISPADVSICSGANSTLTASGGASYSWNTGATNNSITVNPAGTTTYSVTVTNANGCVASTSRIVTVNPLPTASILPAIAAICNGASATLTANGGTSYSWSSGATNASITVNPAATTNYSVTVTDANGCAAFTSRIVTVNPLPTASISVADDTLCLGQGTTLTAAGGVSYLWSTGATAVSIIVSPVSTTNYSVTVTDANGCTAWASRSVIVNSSPAAIIFPPTVSMCNGASATLTTSGGTSYIWNNGITSAFITVSPAVTTTYSVTVTDANGCSVATSRTVNVNALPAAAISPINPSVCYGASTMLTASGGISYSWSNAILTADNLVSPVSNTNYSVTVTSANSCTGTASRLVTVKPHLVTNRQIGICNGESYFAGGALRIISGTYSDTLVAFNGCDSVVVTNLSVHPVYLVSVGVSICQGSGIIIGGSYRTQPGIYYDTLSSRFGCDSIIATNLTVDPYIYQSRNISSCHGESVLAGGAGQTVSGIYYDTLAALSSCDTVMVTNLTFFDTDTTVIDILMHSGSSYYAGGAWQTINGIYYDTLSTVHGCDSIVTTILSVENIVSELTVNAIQRTMTIRTSLEKEYADNTYGSNVVGWDIPRTLDSLITSDHLQWALYNAEGEKKLDFSVDYFSHSSEALSGYKSMGVEGGEGEVLVGSDSSILNTTTSINENFNTYGYVLTQNSPPTDTSYIANPTYPNWIYEVWYEATVQMDAFGSAGYGFHDIVSAHASPDKDDLYPVHEPDSVLPRNCPRNETVKILICQGDSYFVGGGYQTSPGIYYDTLVTAGNCSIIVISNLILLPVSVTDIFVSLCPGESYFAGGSLRNAAGTYYDTLTAANGCDSIISTNLAILPIPTQTVFVNICPGESYYAGGAIRTTTGTYTDLLTTSHGCDSTLITHLTVLPNYQSTRYVSICEGDSVFVGGAYQKNSGIFRDTLAARNGCDSIVVTTLAVQSTVVELRQFGICEGDSLFAEGDYQTMAGNYYDTLQGSQCDSVIITSLTFIEPVTKFVSVVICSNESYFAGGANQTSGGIYYDTFAAAGNCDSIVVTLLQVRSAYSKNINITICEGENIYAAGGNQTSSGTYIDTFTAVNDCDSVVTTTLTVLPVRQTLLEVEICSNETYFAGGVNQTTSGNYFDTLSAANGCDSVVITSLTVNPVYFLDRGVFICSDDSLLVGGLFRNTSGVYYDTFISTAGCDSIIITDLKVNPTNLKKIDARICSGDSLLVGGAWQTIPGIYYDTLSNSFGCDSIVRTKLSIEVGILVSLDTSICFGDSLFVGGAYRTLAGIYYDTLTAAGGCDSIITTNLSIRDISSETIAVQLCAGESIYAGGDYQTLSGTYVDIFTATNGCDSIVTTTVTVLPVSIDTMNALICNGEAYFAGGADQDVSGVYFDTMIAANGCDSIVVTLLDVRPLNINTQIIFICEKDSFLAGGSFRHSDGIYYDTFTTSSGCDSILITDLKINQTNLKKIDARICDGDSLFVGGTWQTTPGIYYDTFSNRFGCDSVVRTNLAIALAIQVSIDTSICEGDMFFVGGANQNSSGIYYDTLAATGGCDSIIVTNLSIKGTKSENIALQLCNGDSVYVGGSFRKLAGVYYDTISQVSGCDSIIITEVSIIPPVADSSFITICDNQSVLIGGEMQNTSGTYYDTLLAANGCDSIIVTVLEVVSTFITSVNISICEGESYFAGGAYRTVNGVYHDSFVSVSGCDSFVTTILKVLQDESSYNPVTICRGQSYFAGGQQRTIPGIYLDTFSSIYGCDSIVLTILNVRSSITRTVNVEICDNEPYFAGGAYRNVPGVYRDTFTTPGGCDSIVSTILNVNESYLINRDISICNGDSIFLQGEFRSVSGLYYDTLHARNFCDSIIASNLLIKNQSLTSRTIIICEGENFFVGGADQDEQGIYYDTLGAFNGCDSIVSTNLIVILNQLTAVHVEICEGEGFFAGGALQVISGLYYDTLLNVHGCDSVVATEILVIPSKHTSVDIAICDGESFFAGGANRTVAGTYFDTLTSNEGCDSIVATHLTVLSPHSIIVPVMICANESYFAGGAFQNVEGAYFDTLTANNGCDSVVITSLKVIPTFTDSIQVTICAHENYFTGGAYQNTSGSYIDTFNSRLGCDSTVITDLIVLPDFTTTNAVSICEGSGYFAQGALQTVSGTYYDTITAPNGCYHIITTELSVLPNKRTDISISICAEEEYFAQGVWQTSSGIYHDTFVAANGCDSLVVTHLTVLPQISDTVDLDICSNERYFAQGAFRNTSGVYYDTFQAESGCDSTVVTNLTVLPVSSYLVNAVICSGEFYLAGGAFQNTTGIYYDTLNTTNGCDSIVSTHLVVLPVYMVNVNYAICQGDSFFVAGAFQSSDGIYHDTLSSFNGCDSIIITNLSVLPVHVTSVNVSICSGETHLAGGAYQDVSGNYFDTLTNGFGCDSMIITNLTVLNPVITTITASICNGDSYFVGGTLQTQSGLYFDYLTDRDGCDSTVITNLIVLSTHYHSNVVSICVGDSIYLQGAYRNLPGFYQDTFENAGGCDSIVNTLLTIIPTPIVYQYFTICSNESIFLGGSNQSLTGTYYDTLMAFNGCDSVIVSYLTVLPNSSSNHSYAICDGEGVLIAGTYRTITGIYYDTLIAFNGCDSIVTTLLQVNPNPVANAGNDQTICYGSSTTITATGGDSYLWSTFESTPTITIALSNSVSLSVVVTDSFGCSDVDSVNIFVHPQLLVSFTGLDTAYCTNEEGDTLTGYPVGGTYNGPGLSGNIFNPELLSPGFYTVTYMYTDSQGCQANSSMTVQIKEVQQTSFTGLDSSYCFTPVSIMLAGFPSGGIFSGPGITANNFVPSDAGVGSHSIEYEYTTPGGCVSADTQSVEILSLPQISFQITDSVLCITEDPAHLHATPLGGAFSGTSVVDSVFYPSLAGAGFHSISYTSTGLNGCSASLAQEVQVRNNPLANIGGLSTGYCINLNAVTLSATPTGGLFSGNGISGNTFDTHAAGLGDHFITYLYVDDYYCAAADTAKISVYPAPQVEIAGIGQQYCEGTPPIYLSGLPSGGVFGGPGVVVNVFDVAKAGVGGPYPVSYLYVDANGCAAADTQWVIVHPRPVLSIDNTNLTYCVDGSAIDLPITPAGGVFHGPGIANNVFNPSLAGIGFHTVVYSYTDSNQCSSTTGVKLIVEVCSGIATISSSDWQVYPNPFVDFIHAQSASHDNSLTTIHLTDILGQIVFKQMLELNTGANTISLKIPELLAPGIYYIEIMSGDKLYVKKLLKIN